jgi:hypothetical protein
MADKVTLQGRLIAVDGTRGRDTARAAQALADELKRRSIRCAVSQWDASGLFAELALGADRRISARSLSLIYAADLAFRLRWEIRPILDSGGVVIAASYVDTAVAFGESVGLPGNWLRELFRFAPAADGTARAVERKRDKPWKQRLDRGYAEYCAAILSRSAPKASSKSTRKKMIGALDSARADKAMPLTPKGVTAFAKILTGNRPAAPSR